VAKPTLPRRWGGVQPPNVFIDPPCVHTPVPSRTDRSPLGRPSRAVLRASLSALRSRIASWPWSVPGLTDLDVCRGPGDETVRDSAACLPDESDLKARDLVGGARQSLPPAPAPQLAARAEPARSCSGQTRRTWGAIDQKRKGRHPAECRPFIRRPVTCRSTTTAKPPQLTSTSGRGWPRRDAAQLVCTSILRGRYSARLGMRTVSRPSFRLASIRSGSSSALSTKLRRNRVTGTST
jgi:hypothetical protein